MASGVPPVVTNSGGAKYLVEDGISGRVAATNKEFIEAVASSVRRRRLEAFDANSGRQLLQRRFLTESERDPNGGPKRPAVKKAREG